MRELETYRKLNAVLREALEDNIQSRWDGWKFYGGYDMGIVDTGALRRSMHSFDNLSDLADAIEEDAIRGQVHFEEPLPDEFERWLYRDEDDDEDEG
jgi:hypothetical protein